ncbi:MAG: transposase [Thermoflexales bacterium]|nr:transposase [Thermoflexales bacterium]
MPVLDHTTLSRRGRTVHICLPKRASGPLHLVLDSSGLKVYG